VRLVGVRGEQQITAGRNRAEKRWGATTVNRWRFFMFVTISMVIVIFLTTPRMNVAGAQGDASEVPATATATATDIPVSIHTATATPSPDPSSTETPTDMPIDTPTSTPLPESPTVEEQTSTPVVPTSAPNSTSAPESIDSIASPDASLDDVDPTGSSTASPISSPTPTALPTATPEVTIHVKSADVDFGQVKADGSVDPSVRGVTSIKGEGGVWYIKERAIRLTVRSTGPWDGTCRAAIGDAGSAFSSSNLSWRLSGSSNWTQFQAEEPNSAFDNACFADRGTETKTYEYDLRIWVASGDTPHPFSADITFSVSPANDV
jgi:hypothetical protein